jgi:pyridoxine/pyridoxamine 5'-phosphate oxidase
MCWWISKDGLNMAIVSKAAAKLSRFDELAGKLYVARLNGRELSQEILVVIAKELDAAGFVLRTELQSKQWRSIAEHNQKNPRQPIKTFEKACLHPVSRRAVRRWMYVAREK